MADLGSLRDRSQEIFTRLLVDRRAVAADTAGEASRLAPAPDAVGFGAADDSGARFSVFDPAHAQSASEMALGLSVLAAGADVVEDGLAAALDEAAEAAAATDPELVHHALSLFVTHDRLGRRLIKPRTAFANPERFAPSSAGQVGFGAGEQGGSTGEERRLDSWREDPLANEHHEHWHEVYPTSGLLPRDWLAWAASALAPARRAGLVEILVGLDDLLQGPSTAWATALDGLGAGEVANAFIERANAVIHGRAWRFFLGRLSPAAYGTLFRLNDRHGELFLYMHQQMLARYDAERRAVGLDPVVPLDDFDVAIPEGYDPGPLIRERFGFETRLAGRSFSPIVRQDLGAMKSAVEDALAAGHWRGADGDVPIDRDNVGDNIEAAAERLRPEIEPGAYPGIHNIGHGRIAQLSEPNAQGIPTGGVMQSTNTAIRDPVFWRWHRFIDDLGFAWQETQAPYDFAADAPPVEVRNSLDEVAAADGATLWQSPDLILCRTADLPGHDTEGFFADHDLDGNAGGGARLAAEAFGGDAFDVAPIDDDPAASPFSVDGTVVPTVSELHTEIRQRPLETTSGELLTISYLTHEPFSLFVRVRNPTDAPVDVTLRIFLAQEPPPPAALSDAATLDAARRAERREWIELDKVLVTLEPGPNIVFRPDVLSSVVKKPADVDPTQPPTPGGGDENDPAYCDCGWPWTLLVPRGTAEGLACRLVVFVTDATIDRVPQSHHCGSMSFCGAVERYPDTRDMGYPFSRPFARSIEDTLHGLANAAGRSLTIRHLGEVG
ncbi:MAG: tyrosinase family protein [Acidobacteriota bacterium]